MTIPGLGDYPAQVQSDANRWSNYLKRHKRRFLQFNIVQSPAPSLSPNRYVATVSVSGAYNEKVLVLDGKFNQSLTAILTRSWQNFATNQLPLEAKEIAGPIPFDDRAFFAYPANFKKKIFGRFL